MSKLFHVAKNQTSFLKCGILGFAGSGKSLTASLLARGLYGKIKSIKPIFYLDTETGSDFLIPRFKSWNIELSVSKSANFSSLIPALKEAEKESDILIIDSVTRFWHDIQDAYKKAFNKKRLIYYDWGPIKDQWREFTDLFINAPLHIIICGRAKDVLEPTENEDGVKELHKIDTKMSVESELGYEPSLLIQMDRFRILGNDGRLSSSFRHVATVIKDRTGLLHGKSFEFLPDNVEKNPSIVYDAFSSWFETLSIGRKHVGIENNGSNPFDGDTELERLENKKQREILIEKIHGELIMKHQGNSTESKMARLVEIDKSFGTKSWLEVERMPISQLQKGLRLIAGKDTK